MFIYNLFCIFTLKSKINQYPPFELTRYHYQSIQICDHINHRVNIALKLSSIFVNFQIHSQNS